MSSEKTNKSYAKRFKLTRKSGVTQRKPGMGHFNAKESRRKQLDKKKTQEFNIKKKTLGQYMPFGQYD